MTRPYNEIIRGKPKKREPKLPVLKEITPEMTEMERRDTEEHNRALVELGKRKDIFGCPLSNMSKI